MALVYGEHGLGKTHAIMWWSIRNDAIYIRANNEMTQSGLLKAIVEELDERPFFYMQENYKLILKHLKNDPKTIIVDEVDYLIGSKNAIEILRDIQDCTGSPLVLVGMGLVDKKISRLKHFDDRLFKKLKFEHFNQEDIKKILNELTNLEFSEEALKYIATRTNQFRKLVQHIDQIEKLASTNQLEVIDEQLVKGVMDERPNIKVMQKIEKMYA
ncbi:AAA family ATPase [bacterium]|nr:AAA family ATPase [bacterium]